MRTRMFQAVCLLQAFKRRAIPGLRVSQGGGAVFPWQYVFSGPHKDVACSLYDQLALFQFPYCKIRFVPWERQALSRGRYDGSAEGDPIGTSQN